MANDKSNESITGLEKAIDAFFDAPVKILTKFSDKFFEYTFRETNHGVFGLFNSPEKIKDAAKKTHEKGYTNFDCLTPFPVHGLEFDMGLKRSKIPYITFFAGLTGFTIAFLMQLSVHEQITTFPYFNSYPLNIGGKPTYSWPAMVPILFELTVLLAGLATAAGLLFLSKMPKASRKVLHPDITNDKFALWIPSDSSNYSEEGVKSFLRELGAEEITVVNDTN